MKFPIFNVLIIGGGFSGTILAVQLLYRAPSLKIAILERESLPGRGIAYGTHYTFHLLNLPADKMSAFAEQPEHFSRWAQANYDPSVQARSFLPRSVYGRYMESLLSHAVANAPRESFTWVKDEALSLTRRHGAFAVQTRNGPELRAESVVITTGNYPPSDPKIPGLHRSDVHYVSYPWSSNALADLPAEGAVLLLGSGLTSMDITVALKSKGFKGQIYIISRRGLVPQPHRVATPWRDFWEPNWPHTIREWVRLVRREVENASAKGWDWRAVVDALRPITQKIWSSLPIKERHRFLRHVRGYWEVHRHRAAPEIADMIADLIEDGQVRVYAGKILRYADHDNVAEVLFLDRKKGTTDTLWVNRVINCTGPESDCRRIQDSLVTSLFVQGLARPDGLFMGLDVNETGALLDVNGRPSNLLFAVGPPRKGCLWETTAVPEIRAQASELAEGLLRSLAFAGGGPGLASDLAKPTNVGVKVN